MEISRRQIAAILLIASVVTGIVYAASWSGSWEKQRGDVRVESISLDIGRFGLAPAAYWLPEPHRLVLVPAPLVPWRDTASTDGDGEVLVVDLETGESRWRRSSDVADPRARHVFWSLPQHLEGHPGEEILHSGDNGTGPSAALSFVGFALSLPTYNSNIPPFGEPGWRFQRRRFGRWRLTVGEAGSSEPALELTLLVLNSAQDVELSSLAAWLPGGEYLVLSPRRGETKLLLAGPFQSESPGESPSSDRGQKS